MRLDYRRVIGETLGHRTTRPNCASFQPDGSPKCALAEAAATPDGAMIIAKSLIAFTQDGDEGLLPQEVRDGKEAKGHEPHTCIHATRLAMRTLHTMIDVGEITGDGAVVVLDRLVELGYGKKISINQPLPETGAMVEVRPVGD